MSVEQQVRDLRELIDRHHTEYKANQAEMRARMESIQNVDAEQGFAIKQMEERLKQGGKRFAEIESVTKPSLWRSIVVGAAIMMAVGGWIWTAARYPNWADVRTLVQEQAPYLKDKPTIMRVVEGYNANMPGILIRLGIMDTKLDNIIKKLERE